MYWFWNLYFMEICPVAGKTIATTTTNSCRVKNWKEEIHMLENT